LKNLDERIRTGKHASFNNFENDNDRNIHNSNEKTEEAKLNDEKIFEVNENWVYVTLNRLIYSEKCLVYYYINILIAVISLLFSLGVLLFIEKNLGKIVLIYFKQNQLF